MTHKNKLEVGNPHKMGQIFLGHLLIKYLQVQQPKKSAKMHFCRMKDMV